MSNSIYKLLSEGLISEEQLDRAQKLFAQHGGTLGMHLVAQSAIDDKRLVELMAQEHSIEIWSKDKFSNLPMSVVDKLGAKEAHAVRMVPLRKEGQRLYMATTDPSHYVAIQRAAKATKMEIRLILIAESDMSWALHKYYGSRPADILPLDEDDVQEPAPVAPEMPVKLQAKEEFVPTGRISGFGWKLSYGEGELGIEVKSPNSIWELPAAVKERPSIRPKPATVSEPSEDEEPLEEEILRPSMKPVGDWFEMPSDGGTITRGDTPSTTPNEEFAPPEPLPPEHFDSKPAEEEPPLPEFPSIPPLPPTETPADEDVADILGKDASSAPAAPAYPIPSEIPDLEPEGDTDTKIDKPVEELLQEPVPDPNDILLQIPKEQERDDVVHLALQYVNNYAQRAIFFAVTQSQIKGHDVVGEDESYDAIRALRLPLSSESTLQKVVEERQMMLCTLGKGTVDAILAASLGGRDPKTIIAPVSISGRTIGLIYADKLKLKHPPMGEIAMLAGIVGNALANIARKSS